jgi:UDP-glucose 4-epimerase
MRVVLLGGIGYVGGRVAHYLRAQGHHVRVTTRRPLALVPSWLAVDEVVQADLVDRMQLRAALSERDVAIHLAAPDEISAAADPGATLRAGGELTWNTLAALAESSPPPLFLYLSTVHVYGSNCHGMVDEQTPPQPVHPYALGRYMGEIVTQMFRGSQRIKALCVRMSNTIGAPLDIDVPRWSLVCNDLCLQAATTRQLVLKTTGTQRRNFLTLHDAARALEFLSLHADAWPADGIIHLGSALNLSIREMADRVAAAVQAGLGFSPPITVAAHAAEGHGEELRFSIDRLAAMGFEWTNRLDDEIRATLALCQQAERQWGRALLRRCRPDLADAAV